MKKLLVVSAPYDDHHSTWVVDGKDVDNIESLFESNRWQELEDYEVSELDDNFVARIEAKIGRAPEELKDVYEYFQLLAEDETVSLEDFSKEVIFCVNSDRGSWSSYCWVELKGK